MQKRWMVSVFFTVFIWSVGAFGVYYVSHSVPNQLQEPSTILAEETVQTKETESKDLKEIIYETQKSVVKIELADGSLGSGFLFNDKGDVVTNAHVVAGVENVTVTTADSNEFSGKVIGISSDVDVAVVRVDGLKGMDPLKIRSKDLAEMGDEVLALGSPFGLEKTVTTGIISGVERDLDLEPYRYEDVYQISAPIAPGNSGGPLILQETGEVLGINSAGSDQGAIGFSIPIVNVLSLIEGWSDTPMTTLPNVVSANEKHYEEASYNTADKDMAIYLVDYFYESLNYADYVTAYALLGSNWQSDISYETFRDGYMQTKSVFIDDIVAANSGDEVGVTAFITAEETNNGLTSYSKYKVKYVVGYENDELKILSGEGEVIK
ncbi:serine protease [Oceanobacillus halophilus]|uniref:Serine protease n=1 Tax=Oceanobacillus halophilus TaxID=930130 RepID=A0A495A818_9BACI|nr:trypsin-like peptidase domain-containing protein [Oceanobacillus halophilus]RKQ35869.1 serine protease [Oceanobacillus halophilus]